MNTFYGQRHVACTRMSKILSSKKSFESNIELLLKVKHVTTDEKIYLLATR